MKSQAERQKNYRNRHKEDSVYLQRKKDYNFDYYRKHSEYFQKHNKKTYDLKRDELVEYQRRYRESNKELLRNVRKNRYDKLRHDLFEILGGAICIRCGFSDKRALQLDHINGGGNVIHKKFRGKNMYKIYLQNPELTKQTLQVLCANCNWIKRHENNEDYGRSYRMSEVAV